jgi:aminomethyltransferase
MLLKDMFIEEKFDFAVDENDIKIPGISPFPEHEYDAVREGIAATDLSNVLIYEVSGDEAVDYLDFVMAGSVFRLREEHILHTLCIDEQGEILSDIYILNIDSEQYFVLADGGDYNTLDDFLRKSVDEFEVKIKDVRDEYGLFSIDGPYSSSCVKETFGPEILGLRYLAFLPFEENGRSSYICRAGKTGEYGFWIMSPRVKSVSIFKKIWKIAIETRYPTSLYGRRLHEFFRLENNFLNLARVGKYTKNPFELGLFWTIELDKEMAAKSAIKKIVKRNIGKKVIGLRSSKGGIREGDAIYYKEEEIGRVIDAQHIFASKEQIGLGLLDVDYGYTGLNYFAGEDPVEIETVNRPFLLNKSLSINVS